MRESKIHLVLSELMGNMSEAALAKAIDIPKATINRVLSGKTPDPRAGTLVPIAKYFNISIDQLLGLTPITANSPLEQTHSKLLEIPYVECENLVKFTKNEYSIVKKYGISVLGEQKLDSNCFVTHLKTDELAPLFAYGSLLVITRDINNLKNNESVLAHDLNNDAIYFRKYMRIQDLEFLSSPNPKYEIFQLSKTMVVYGKIIEGRVFG